MAMNKTRYLAKKVLDHFLGRAAYAFPANVYLALFSADPTELGSLVNEITQAGYARVEISALLGDTVLETGVITNSADIVFGPATEDWPEITHAGVMDSATIGAGNMLYFGPAVTSRVVDENDDFPVRIGQLTITES